VQKKSLVKGKPALIDFLGIPNTTHFSTGDSVYTYFVAPGSQCYNKDWRNAKYGVLSEQIMFFIRGNGIVRAVTGPICL
jgi:hypothetical protein